VNLCDIERFEKLSSKLPVNGHRVTDDRAPDQRKVSRSAQEQEQQRNSTLWNFWHDDT
jgi:hypothetical protein